MSSEASAAVKLPLRAQLLYGVGEIPVTLTMALVGTFVLFFYNSVMHLPATLAGLGLTLGLAADAFLDPYIGYLSDKSTHSFGRRHIFMLVGSLAAGPCFWLMMSPPQNLSTPALFAWLLLSSVAFRFFMAVYRIPYLSLGAEMTSDYHERTMVIAIRSLLGLLGMVGGAALPFWLFFTATGDGSDPKLAYAGYPQMGIFFGAAMSISGLITVFGTREQRTSAATKGHAPAAFRHSLIEFLRNPDYCVLWSCFSLAIAALVFNFSLTVQYLTWYVEIAESSALSTIQTCLYGGAAAGVVAWIWLARRGEKAALMKSSMLGLAIALGGATFLFGPGHLFGTGDGRILAAGNVIAGLFASALWVLPFSMMADVVDEDELRNGARREGEAFGLLNFAEKLAGGVALLLSGTVLTYFVHLEPGAAKQAPDVAQRLGYAYGVIPGVFLAAAALLLAKYKLTRQRVAEIQARLRPSSMAQTSR